MDHGVAEADLLRIPGTSKEKLKRWRRAGLIPRPEQVHVAGERGSVSVYPAGTDTLLTALCRLHRRERRLNELGLQLWWDGHDLPEATVRAILIALSDKLIGDFHRLVQGSTGDQFDAADRLASDVLASGDRSPVIRLLRSQVGGSENLATVLTVIAQLAFGEQPIWTTTDGGPDEPELSPEQLVANTLATQLPGQDDPGPHTPVALVFARMQKAGILPLRNLGQVIESAGTEELSRGRDDARAFIDDGGVVVQALETVYGRNSFGLGLIRVVGRPHGRAPRQAFITALFIAMRREFTDAENAALDAFCQLLRKAAPDARTHLKQRKKHRPKPPATTRPRDRGNGPGARHTERNLPHAKPD